MKQILLIFTLFLLSIIPSVAATLKFDVNPICVAARLAEQEDSVRIASICKYHGYEAQPSEDGYAVFKNPNGDIIRFTISDGINGRKYPTIEIKTITSHKGMEDILENINYKNQGHSYERRLIDRIIRCVPTHNHILRFTTHPKNKN